MLPSPVIRGGGAGGSVQMLDWDGNVVWNFNYAVNFQYRQHHDVAHLPNGNVLVLAWEYKSFAEAVAAGRDPATIGSSGLWPEHIIEVEPIFPDGGNIVWEWHAWDHLVQDFDSAKANYGQPEEHPELLDINYVNNIVNEPADWMHANALDYNADLDQIILSSALFNEFYIIDHSTNSAEAASHSGGNIGKGGDLLYRWGNPQTYRAGIAADRKLYNQHDVHWIPSHLPDGGKIMLFNNGNGRPGGEYSSVEVIAPPLLPDGSYAYTPGTAYAPSNAEWIYTATPPNALYSRIISGAQRLPNGNTLICNGINGLFWEVTPLDEIVWRYRNPDSAFGLTLQGELPPTGTNSVFRAYRYAPDFAGFDGKDLTPDEPLELNPLPDVCHIIDGTNNDAISGGGGELTVYPNPASKDLLMRLDPTLVVNKQTASIKLLNVLGEILATKSVDASGQARFDVSNVPPGIYVVQWQKQICAKINHNEVIAIA